MLLATAQFATLKHEEVELLRNKCELQESELSLLRAQIRNMGAVLPLINDQAEQTDANRTSEEGTVASSGGGTVPTPRAAAPPTVDMMSGGGGGAPNRAAVAAAAPAIAPTAMPTALPASAAAAMAVVPPTSAAAAGIVPCPPLRGSGPKKRTNADRKHKKRGGNRRGQVWCCEHADCDFDGQFGRWRQANGTWVDERPFVMNPDTGKPRQTYGRGDSAE